MKTKTAILILLAVVLGTSAAPAATFDTGILPIFEPEPSAGCTRSEWGYECVILALRRCEWVKYCVAWECQA